MNDNKRKLYDALSNDYDMGTYEQFRKDLEDKDKRRKLYDATSDAYDFGDYDQFEAQLGYGQSQSAPSAEEINSDSAGHVMPKPAMENRNWEVQMGNGHSRATVEKPEPVDVPVPQRPEGQEPSDDGTAASSGDVRSYLENANRQQVANLSRDISSRLDEAQTKSRDIYMKEQEDARKGGFLSTLAHAIAASGHNPEGGSGGMSDAQQRTLQGANSELQSEISKLEAAKKAMSNAKEIIAEADKSVQEGKFPRFVKGAARGFGDKLFDVNTWDMGVSDTKNSIELLKALRKYDEGKPLSESEQMLLDAKSVELATNAYFGSYIGRGYKAGAVTAQSLPFMLEMAVNPASTLGESTQSMLARYALSRFAKKGATRAAQKFATKAAGAAGRALGDIAGSAVMAGTSGAVRVAGDAIDRYAGDIETDMDGQGQTVFAGHDPESLGKSIAKAFTSTAIENHSEMLGEYFAPALGIVSKLGRKGMEKFGLKKVVDFVDDVSATDAAKLIADFQKRTKWNGTIGEYAEEVAGNIENAILVGDNTLDASDDTGVFNLDQNIDTFLGVALMGGVFSAVRTAMWRTPKYRARMEMEKARDEARTKYGSEAWQEIEDRMAEAGDSGMSAVLSTVIAGENSPEKAKALLDYAKSIKKYEGMLAGDEKRREIASPEATDLETSYENGYTLSTPQEVHDAKLMFEYQEAMLQKALGTSDIDIDTIMLGNEMGTLTDEQKSVAMDYLNAKATFDGVIDRVRDDLDSRISSVENAIDASTNRDTGMLQPASLVDDRPVHIISGIVRLTPDGTMVDTRNSENFIIVRDDRTGRMETISPSDINRLENEIDPAMEKQAARQQIQDVYGSREADSIDGVLAFNSGDTYTLTNGQGQSFPVQIVENEQGSTDNGDGTVNVILNNDIDPQTGQPRITQMPKEQIQEMAEATNLSRLQQYEQQKLARAAEQAETDATGRTPENPFRINDRITLSDAETGNVENGVVGSELTDDGKYEVVVEKQDGSQSILYLSPSELEQLGAKLEQPVAVEERNAPVLEQKQPVPAQKQPVLEQKTEKAEQESAMSRIPLDRDGVPQFEQAQPSDTWEALLELNSGNAVEAEDTARQMYENASKNLDKAQKTKPKSGTSVMEIQRNKAERNGQIDELRKSVDFWGKVLSFPEAVRKSASAAAAAEVRQKEDAKREAVRQAKENLAKGRKLMQQKGTYYKDDAKLGDYLDFHDYALRMIANGRVKFVWKNDADNNSIKGLGGHLGLEDSESERKALFSLLANQDKGGLRPDDAAEQLSEEYNSSLGAEVISSSEALDVILDIIRTYGGKTRDMMNAAIDAHAMAGMDERGHDEDSQGNPINSDGSLYVESVSSIDEITDEDFTNPTRSIVLPEIPQTVDEAIGANGKPVVIKKNIFMRNSQTHPEVTPQQAREILSSALYRPDLYGQNQKTSRPYNWIVINTKDSAGQNRLVVLEVNENKDNVEIIHWYNARNSSIEQIKRQAQKEGGLILILPSETEEAGGLSSRQSGLSSEGKDNVKKTESQEGSGKKVLIKGKKWETTTEPEAYRSNTKKRTNSHDIVWFIGNKRYGSTTAERDLIEAEAAEYGGYVGAWNAYEEGKILLGKNEAALMKKMAEQESANKTTEALSSNSSEKHLAENPNDLPDLLPAQENNASSEEDNMSSEGKDTNISEGSNTGSEKSVAEQITEQREVVNTEPTEAQKEAGNYRMGHVKIDGMDVTIENPKGSIRRGTDADGKKWESEMHYDYGYIRGTKAVDNDHIDIFLSDNPETGNVFVVDQVNPKTGEFDESKVMYGFASEQEARDAYLSNYEKGWKGLGKITEVTREEFKKWIESSTRKTKPFSEYASVKTAEAQKEKSIQGLEGYSREEIKGIVTDHINDVMRDYDIDAEIIGMDIHGSRNRHDARPDSDLDVVVEYSGEIREDDMFNALNGEEDALSIEGIRVDINPIRKEETGDLQDYMKQSEEYDKEKSERANVKPLDGNAQKNIIVDAFREWNGNLRNKYRSSPQFSELDNAISIAKYQADEGNVKPDAQKNFEKAVRLIPELYFGSGDIQFSIGKKNYETTSSGVKDFAEKYGVSQEAVEDYANGMRLGTGAGCGLALLNIRRDFRLANSTLKFAEFSHEYAKLKQELFDKFGDYEKLKAQQIAEADARRDTMEAARKRIEEEQQRKKAEYEARIARYKGMSLEELDSEYFKALENNDEISARDIVDEVARRNGYADVTSDYQGAGAWAAPSRPGGYTDEERRASLETDSPDLSLEDISLGYTLQPDDIFDHPERYMQSDSTSKEAARAIKATLNALKKGNKDAKIKVFRAVPLSVKEGRLRNGDWVTPSRAYADMHGNHRLEGEYRVIEEEVPAKDLWWDGNDVREWGYDDGTARRYANVENNTKLNDVITRDDAGNIIPPSRRFDLGNADERYQISGRKAIDEGSEESRIAYEAVKEQFDRIGIPVELLSDQAMREMAINATMLDTVLPEDESSFKGTVISSIDGAKILNNLDKAIERYNENPDNRPWTFIGDLASALGSSDKDKSSQYATFETKNGQVVTIRVSNHNATVSNFDNAGESNGISIVISRKPNEGITNDGDANIVEFFYPDKALNKADGKPLVEILKSIKQSLYSGEYKDTTGLAQREEVNAKDVPEFMTVYHGSGAKFDRFDHSHMGEGEGNQAFGWGTYVTEVEGIGRTYAEAAAKYDGKQPKRNLYTVEIPEDINSDLSKDEILKGLDSIGKELFSGYGLNDAQINAMFGTTRQWYELGRTATSDFFPLKEAFKTYGIDAETIDKRIHDEAMEDRRKNPAGYGQYLSWEKPLGEYGSNRLDGVILGVFEPLSKGVLELKTGKDIYNLLSRQYGSAQAASEKLEDLGYIGISYPAQYMSGGRSDGARNYVIFNENDAKITDRIEFLREPDGTVYGATVGGKIYLNRERLNPNTPIHEYTHLWFSALEKANPELYKRGVELMKQLPIWEEVKTDPNYANLSGDDAIASECLSRLVGDKGAEKLTELAKKAMVRGDIIGTANRISLIEEFKDWLKKFWTWVRDSFAPWTKEEASRVSVDDIQNMVLSDLVKGVNPLANAREESELKKTNDKFNEQLETFTIETADRYNFNLGRPSSVLLSAGIENKPIRLHGSKVAKKIRKHGFQASALRDLPMAIAHPIAVFDNLGREGNRSILTELKTDNGNVLVSIDLGRGTEVDFNIVSSAFGKNSKGVLGWINGGKMKFVDKEKALNYLHLSAPIAEASDNAELLSAANIVKEFENPSDKERKPEFQFIGEKGAAHMDKVEEATIRLDNLSIARQMEDADKDAKTIKLATGWERGADGKWRYEISDANIKDTIDLGKGISKKRFEEDMLWNSGRLGNVIEAPELFKAYPQLKDIHIETDSIVNDMPSNGEFNANSNRITIHAYRLKYLNSILNHEIQHAIQHIEGFATGGTPEHVEKEFDAAKTEWRARAYAHELEETAKELGGEYNLTEVENALGKEYKEMGMEDLLPDKETRIKGANYFARGYADRSMDEAIKRFHLDESAGSDFNPYIEYMHIAGEVEARNVSARLGMTPEERRRTLASETEDVSREDQIILNDALIGDSHYEEEPEIDRIVRETKENGSRAPQDVEAAAAKLAESLGEKVRIVRDVNEIENRNKKVQESQRRSKGWFNTGTGEIVVVLPNATGIEDVQATIMHEAVGHKGLRELVGDDRFDDFLDKVYAAATKATRLEIVSLARRNHWDFRLATEEYIAGLAEKGFSGRENRTLFGKIKDFFLDMLSRAKIALGFNIGDNELRYMLWRTYQMRTSRGILAKANDMAVQQELKVGNFREDNSSPVSFLKQMQDNAETLVPRQLTKEIWDNEIKGKVFSTPIGVVKLGENQYEKNIKKGRELEFGMLIPTIERPDAIFEEDAPEAGAERQTKYVFVKSFVENGVKKINYASVSVRKDGMEVVASSHYLRDKQMLNKIEKERMLWNRFASGSELSAQGGSTAQSNALSLDANLLKGVKKTNSDEEILSGDDSRLRFRTSANGGSSNTARDIYEEKTRVIDRNGRKSDTANLMRRLKEAYVDSMQSLKYLQDAISEETGKPVEDFENAYLAENSMSSKNKAQTDIYLNRFFNPIKDAIRDLQKEGAEYGDIVRYLMAKHGLERNEVFSKRDAEKDGGVWDGSVRRDYSGLTELTRRDTDTVAPRIDEITSRAEDIVRKFEMDHDTDVLWETINAATKDTLRTSYITGMLTKDNYEMVRSMFRYYIPLRGWSENTASAVYDYLSDARPKTSSIVKAATGRTTISDDPIATIAYMGQSAIIQGNRNLMKQKLLNLALNHKTGLLTVSRQWEVLDPVTGMWTPRDPDIPADAAPEQVADIVADFEKDMKEAEKKGVARLSRGKLDTGKHLTAYEGQEHIIKVKRGGIDYSIYLNGNPRAAQAVNGMTNPDAVDSWLIRKARVIKNFMARMFTSQNPAFIISNLSRDVIFAGTAVYAKEDAKYAARYAKNITVALAKGQLIGLIHRFETDRLDNSKDLDRYFGEFIRNGGETGFTQLNTVDDFKRDIDRFAREMKQGQVMKVSIKVWNGIWDGIEYMNRCAEDATRFSVYMTSRQMGRSVERSISDAKEITVNFNRKGSGGFGARLMNFAYIFFNAAVQSLANAGKIMYEHPMKALAALGAFSAAGFMAPLLAQAIISAFGGDDDAYWDLPEWVRRNNFVFYIPWSDNKFLIIPISQELRPFYAMGEIAMSVMMGKEEVLDGLKSAAGSFMDLLPIDFMGNGGNLAISLTPTVAQPFAQLVANTDYFGSPIYRRNDYNKLDPAWTKAYKGTSPMLVNASKWLNEVTGGDDVKRGWIDPINNPAVIEHLFESYLGGTGKTINRAAKTFSMIWNPDMRDIRNVPIASTFIQESDDERVAGNQLNREYFKLMDEFKETSHTVSGYKKKARMGSMEYADKLNEFMETPDFERYSKARGYANTISKLRQALKRAQESGEDVMVEENLQQILHDLKRQMVEELKEQ